MRRSRGAKRRRMICGMTPKNGYMVVGEPLEIIGLEVAILVYLNGQREQITGVELSGKYNIADAIHHAIAENCHMEIDGRRVGFA